MGRLRSLLVLLVGALVMMSTPGYALAEERISISPSSGTRETQVTVTGTGWTHRSFAQGVPIHLSVNRGNGDHDSLGTLARPVPDSAGTFEVTVRIPASASGRLLTFTAIDGSGGGPRADFTLSGTDEGGPIDPGAAPDGGPSPGVGEPDPGPSPNGSGSGQEPPDVGEPDPGPSPNGSGSGQESPDPGSVREAPDRGPGAGQPDSSRGPVRDSVPDPVDGSPGWYCVVGPDGACQGLQNPTPNSRITWNVYLDWVVEFTEGAERVTGILQCGNFKMAECLKFAAEALAEQYPAVGDTISALPCAGAARARSVEDAIGACLGLGTVGLRSIVSAIHSVAERDQELKAFLDSEMPTISPPGTGFFDQLIENLRKLLGL
jgi:hypothetical protein